MTITVPDAPNGLTGHRLVARRTRRYFESLRWLIGTLFRFRPLKASTIIGLIAVGRTMQAGAFSLIVWYFLAIEKNTPIAYLGQSIEPRAGTTMAVAIFGVTIVLIAATFVIYLSARMAFDLAMKFAEHIIEDVLTVENAWPGRATLANGGVMSMQAQMVVRAKIHLFRPINVLLMLPRALLLAIPAIGGMIWIAGEVVAFLALLAAPAVALNYVISRSVVVAQRQRKIAQRIYRGEEKQTISAIGDETAAWSARETGARRLMAGKANRDAVRTFSVRIIAPAQSEFVANVLAAIAVASIGVYLGYKAINGTMPLALIVAFFVLLRLAVNGLTSIALSLTTYARFYEVVRNAYEYLSSTKARTAKFNGRPILHVPAPPAADQAPGPASASTQAPAPASTPDSAQGSGSKKPGPDQAGAGDTVAIVAVPGAIDTDIPVVRGTPVAIVSPAEINRYTQYFFTFALTQKARHAARRNLNAVTLRCTLALAEPDNLKQHGLLALEPDELKKRIAAAPIADRAPDVALIRAAAQDPDGVSKKDQARIAMLTAFLSSTELLILDARLLAKLSPNGRKSWLESLSGRYIAVAYILDNFSGCEAGETHAIFLDNERAVAVVKAEDAAAAATVVAANFKAGKDAAPEDDEMEEEG